MRILRLVFVLRPLISVLAIAGTQASPGLAEERATPTIKACHICDEGLPGGTAAPRPVVHALLFWMNGCSSCHYVLDDVLPPLHEKYGDQLEVLRVEIVSLEDTKRLYEIAAAYGIPREHVQVPFLIVGEHVLIGRGQIPAELPGLIEQYLAQGGVDLPDVLEPGVVQAAQPTSYPSGCGPEVGCEETAASDETAVAGPIETTASAAQFLSNGFWIAIVVMIGMIVALAYTLVRLVGGMPTRREPRTLHVWRQWTILGLALLGLGVAGYLAYVETQAVPAACGPIGDCNAVQGSPYARLFGILPVGVLGVIAYAAILCVWVWGQLGTGRLATYAPRLMLGISVAGVLFSLYLTYLEPFVIGAVCAWCLTSAVIVTALTVLSLQPALEARGTRP